MINLPIVLLSTAWGPRHGGINAFNFDLCKALAAQLDQCRPVVCIVPKASDGEKQDAKAAKVQLIETGHAQFDSGDVVKALREAGYSSASWWIGHDVVTGPITLKVAALADTGQTALIHHMSYLSYTAYKHAKGAEAAARHEEQKHLFNKADRTFAVGPVLRDSLRDILSEDKPAPKMLIPGLPDIKVRQPARVFSAMVFGRMDQADDRIKQGRLAVAGFTAAYDQAASTAGSPPLLRNQRPIINVIGLDPKDGDTEASLQELCQRRGTRGLPNLIAQPFIEDRERLFQALSSSHIALMPSWHEGFGLTGWEAIGAGVPLIISEKSGLYALIKELTPGLETGCLYPVPIGGSYGTEGEENFSDGDVETIRNAVLTIAAEYDHRKNSAKTLKQALQVKGVSWGDTSRQLLSALGINDSLPSLPPASNPRPLDPVPPAPTSQVLIDRRQPLPEGAEIYDSLLLRPESQVVPFQDFLEPLCQDILKWTLDEKGSPQRTALRLYAAEGGSGKTRLMIEVCSRLLDRAERDWVAGFIGDRRGKGNLAAEITTLVNAHPRMLLVFDYAETRRGDVRTVIGAALRAPASHRVRIVLLGRGQGDWWDLLREEATTDQQLHHFLHSLEGTCGPFDLPKPSADDINSRRYLFDEAKKSFSRFISSTSVAMVIPDLSAMPFRQILFIQLSALAALHGRRLEDKASLLDATLSRERDYWARCLEAEGFDRELLDGLAQAVAILTLINGTQSAKEAKEILVATPRLRHLDQPARDRLFDLLRRLYPRGSGIDALRPDLLGERLVRACLTKDGEIIEEILDTNKHPDWIASTLTVLTRIAQHGERRWLEAALQPGNLTIRLVERAMSVAVAVGDPLGSVLADSLRNASRKTWRGIVNHMAVKIPEQTIALSSFSEVILTRKIELLEEGIGKSSFSEEEYAISLENLSIRLSSNGKVEAALDCSIKASKLIHSKRFQRTSHLQQFISTNTNNQANILRCLGRHEESLAAAQAAEAMWRELAAARPDAHRADWATSLNNLGSHLSDVGRYEEALTAAQAAEAMRRELAAARPDVYRADWATSLNNLGSRLGDVGRYEEALTAARAAEAMWRELAAAGPDAYRPNWATSLGNLGGRLGNVGRYEEALTAARAAEAMWRELAAARPDVYRGHWATSLGNLGSRLSGVGRYEEALTVAQAAEAMWRELAEARPDAHRADWATFLGNLGSHLSDVGQYDEALTAAQATEAMWRELAAARPDAHRADWARSLNNLGSHLSDVGRYDEALTAAQAAETMRRELAAARPDAHRADWARSLGNLGSHLSNVGRYEEALTAAQAAEAMWRELAAARPDAHRADWAGSLDNLGSHLTGVGRYEEALTVVQAAEAMWQELAAARPDAHRADWATSLGNLGSHLSDGGRYEEALTTAQATEAMWRELAAVRPDAHRADWASALVSCASVALRLSRPTAALVLAEQAVDLFHVVLSRQPLRFAIQLGWSQVVVAAALIELGRIREAVATADSALNRFSTDAKIHPAFLEPNHAMALAIRARDPELVQSDAVDLARQALNLLEPHFRRRARSLVYEMDMVAGSLYATAEPSDPNPLPSDIAAILNKARPTLALT